MPHLDVNLGDVLRSAEGAVRGSADTAAVVLRVTPIDVRVDIAIDRLLEAVTGLIGDAIQVTPVGGTVSVDAQRIGDDVMVWIRDEGAGEVEAVQSSEQWARARLNTDGDRLWSESMPPLGTTFVLRLPLSD